jgi:hypothetical protein
MNKNSKTSAITMLPLALGLLAVAGSPSVALASDKPEAPHLAGKWTLNANQSDNAKQKVDEAEQNSQMSQRGSGGNYPAGGTGGGYPGTDYPAGGNSGGGYPGGGGMGRGGGGMGGPGMGGMGRGGMGRGPGGGTAQGGGINGEDLDSLATDSKALTIDQNDKQISITDDADHTETLYADGKKHKGDDSSGDKTGIKTHWNGNRLVAESKLGHSGKLAETYELSADGKQLYVTSELDNSHLSSPLVIRRVYDSSAPPAQ